MLHPPKLLCCLQVTLSKASFSVASLWHLVWVTDGAGIRSECEDKKNKLTQKKLSFCRCGSPERSSAGSFFIQQLSNENHTVTKTTSEGPGVWIKTTERQDLLRYGTCVRLHSSILSDLKQVFDLTFVGTHINVNKEKRKYTFKL